MTARDGKATRDRVVRIATELFAERGFDATGVQELSDATGLGRGALYYHIKSKHKLLASIAVTLLERANLNAREILERDEGVESRLRTLGAHLLEDLAQNRDAWVTSMRDWEALEGDDRQRVLALRREYELLWQRILDEGAAAGTIHPVHPMLRRAIIGMFTSSYRWIEAQGPMAPQEISEMYLHMVLEGLRA